MLVDDPLVLDNGDPFMQMIAKINGNDAEPKRLQAGVYQIGHFGCSRWPSAEYDEYADLTINGHNILHGGVLLP